MDSQVHWLGYIPSHWRTVPHWSCFRRTKRTGCPDEELLSVYRDYGVIPKSSRNDNFNKASEDLSAYQLVEPRDLVINKMKAWQGAVAISSYRGIVSPAYFVFQALHSFNDRYLHYLLRSLRYVTGYLCASKGIRVNQWDLDPEQHSKMPVVIPPLPEQASIASFLDRETAKIDALIAEQERMIELLQEKRQASISLAVTRGLNRKAVMKDSGVEWIGRVPDGWNVTPLKWLTQPDRPIMYGIVLPGPDVGEGVPILKGGNVKPSRMKLEEMARTTSEIEAPYARARLRRGDLVYSIRGTIGDCEQVPGELEGSNITQDVARVSIDGCADPQYVRWALLSTPVREELSCGSLGAAVRGVNIFDLKRVLIPTPPLHEQTEIANFVSNKTLEIDGLIEASACAIDLLAERRAVLISEAVTGQIDVGSLVDQEAA